MNQKAYVACNFKLDGKYSERVLLPAKAIADCHHNEGCAVNGTAVAAVLIDRPITFLREFAYSVCSLDSRKTTHCEIWGVFVDNTWQHLPHLLLEV